ncbi:AMP-binding protein [Nocardia sp. alder85J]|nr:AMP-binding protein [Nocardia sp. alder85J]MCX4096679.1 AMP-binding protein [Nocardia sp. alder85J]
MTLRRRLNLDHRRIVALIAHKSVRTIAAVGAVLAEGHSAALISPAFGPDVRRAVLDSVRADLIFDDAESDTFQEIGTAERVPETAQRVILTTSGSTGVPKPVSLPLERVAAFIRWGVGHFDLGPGSVVWSYAPLNFDLSLLEVWATLHAGGTVVLISPEQSVDGRRLIARLREHPPTVLQSVPLLHRVLAGHATKPIDRTRHVIVTGERFPVELLPAMRRLFPHAEIHNVYGSTETNDSLMFTVPRTWQGAEMPAGRPLPGVHAHLIDPSGSLIEGPGRGELITRTPFQFDEYIGLPGRTRSVLLNGIDPAGDSWYFRTGDIFRRASDGLLYPVGRDDHMVKIRGVRTDLAEIEAVLKSHAHIRDAAVVAVAENGDALVLAAYIVAGGDLDKFQLRLELSRKLPRTSIPEKFSYVTTLPRTATGKVDRRALSLN